jgi:hypothetical protein
MSNLGPTLERAGALIVATAPVWSTAITVWWLLQ